MDDTELIRSKLLKYVIHYHNKPHINMYWVTNSIIKRLRNGEQISEKQFNTLIRWLEREKEFSKLDRSTLKQYFSPIIYNTKHYTKGKKYDQSTSNTLEQFFN